MSYNILDGGVGRADPLAEVIEAQRADVVALTEADDAAVIDRIAGRLKMDVIVAAGRSHSVALLSRYTIAESINHAALPNSQAECFLEAKLEAGSETWTIGVNGGGSRPVMLANGQHLIVGEFDDALAASMISAGYIDTFAAMHPGAKSAVTFPTRQPTARPDRIFIHGIGRERLSNAWIETDRLAKYASDHFPVGLEIG